MFMPLDDVPFYLWSSNLKMQGIFIQDFYNFMSIQFLDIPWNFPDQFLIFQDNLFGRFQIWVIFTLCGHKRKIRQIIPIWGLSNKLTGPWLKDFLPNFPSFSWREKEKLVSLIHSYFPGNFEILDLRSLNKSYRFMKNMHTIKLIDELFTLSWKL